MSRNPDFPRPRESASSHTRKRTIIRRSTPVVSQPNCCRETKFPVHKRMRDPTITTAPARNQTFRVSNSGCLCPNEVGEEQNVPVASNLTFSRDIEPRLDQTRILPRSDIPQMTVPCPMNTTRTLAQPGLNITRNLVQQSLNTTRHMVQPGLNITRNLGQPSVNTTRQPELNITRNLGQNYGPPRQNMAVPRGVQPPLDQRRVLPRSKIPRLAARPQMNTTRVSVRPTLNTTRNVVQSGLNITRNVQPPMNTTTVSVRPTLNTTRNVVQPGLNITRNVQPPLNVTRNMGYPPINITRNITQSSSSPGYQTVSDRSSLIARINARRPLNDTYFPYQVDLGPWRNVVIPENLQMVDLAPGANKTFPRLAVPLPSRNYSTYNDPQPILDLKEVAQHRKKAPRFYSTPTTSGFVNQGTSISSVWGQEVERPFTPETSYSFADSSIGWEGGVRMDSFNVYRPMTPSPRKINVPQRGHVTYEQPPKLATRIPTPHKTHTYLPDPFYIHNPNPIRKSHDFPSNDQPRAATTLPTSNQAHSYLQVPNNLHYPYNNLPTPEPNSCSFRSIQPSPCMTPPLPSCGTSGESPQLSQTYSVDKTDEVTRDNDAEEENKNDFCTVLEIRTPCPENPCVPEKPLQLSINVSCVDPSMLITPDKRVEVIKHVPEPLPSTTSEQKVNDVPSDCACG